jgi:hypothetical protein
LHLFYVCVCFAFVLCLCLICICFIFVFALHLFYFCVCFAFVLFLCLLCICFIFVFALHLFYFCVCFAFVLFLCLNFRLQFDLQDHFLQRRARGCQTVAQHDLDRCAFQSSVAAASGALQQLRGDCNQILNQFARDMEVDRLQA